MFGKRGKWEEIKGKENREWMRAMRLLSCLMKKKKEGLGGKRKNILIKLSKKYFWKHKGKIRFKKKKKNEGDETDNEINERPKHPPIFLFGKLFVLAMDIQSTLAFKEQKKKSILAKFVS